MFHILWFQIPLPDGFLFLNAPIIQFVANIAAWILIALVVNFILLRVIRFITRQLPGDLEDIVFGILRGPLILLLLVLGTVRSLELLPLTEAASKFINLVAYTIVTIVVTHILGRTIRDIFVYYGEKWARRTASRVDDVLIPVLNLFGPVALVLAAALIILPMWGFNVTSVLVGAGVVGLVLGLALQDTLSNIFSGLSLLVEAPFRTGDLITLSDGRIGEVQRIGIRSTQLYSISEHATIYVPNKTFVNSTLTNITKPTVDQKLTMDISVDGTKEWMQVEEGLRRIATAHPATLVMDLHTKIPLLKDQIQIVRQRATILDPSDPAVFRLVTEAEQNEKNIVRLEKEAVLNNNLLGLQEACRNLIRGIRAREAKGLTDAERQEIFCQFISPLDAQLDLVLTSSQAWAEEPDPWLDDSDFWNLRKAWEERNLELRSIWEKVKKAINHPNDRSEMRLDDLVREMLSWIQQEYKILPAFWKNPMVTFKEFDDSNAILQLSYYVDNIRLEHDERADRVRTEIGRQVRDFLYEMKVWGNHS